MVRGASKASTSNDSVFVDWLQRIGMKQHEGKPILAHYMQRNTTGTWDTMLQHLRTKKVDWWIFLRNQMGRDNVQSARTRYLDRFVFICKEEPSEPYIDSLLGVEECQIQLRVGKACTVSCPGCRKRDIRIEALENQLRRFGKASETDERLELMLKEFNRRYVVDPDVHAPRNMVRVDLENHLKRTIGENETLLARDKLWTAFVNEIAKVGAVGYSGLRCRLRQQSIAHALNLSGPAWNDAAGLRAGKRPRAGES